MNNPVATALRRPAPEKQNHQSSMDLTEKWPKGGRGRQQRQRKKNPQEDSWHSSWDQFWRDWETDWGSAEEWREESWHATKLGLLAPLTTVCGPAPAGRSRWERGCFPHFAPDPARRQIPMLFKIIAEEDFTENLDLVAAPGAPCEDAEESAQAGGVEDEDAEELKDVASFTALGTGNRAHAERHRDCHECGVQAACR